MNISLIRRFFVRGLGSNRRRLFKTVTLLVVVGMIWGVAHLITAIVPASHVPNIDDAKDDDDRVMLNPVAADIIRSLRLHQHRNALVRKASQFDHPALREDHAARWPPQVLRTGASSNRTQDEQLEVILTGKRASSPSELQQQQQPVKVGPGSIVSVNTSNGRVPPASHQRLLQALMFRARPPDSAYNINASLSDRTPLDRPLPDSRQEACRERYYRTTLLPAVSVIVPFYNEPLSMLLRTLHSIVGRTPARLLHEVVLIDDASDNLDLGLPLEKYLQLLPKVVLLRNSYRLGLIRTRQLGADVARAPVLVFQDAHTECNVGWLEPLLHEISKDRKVIVQPVIDNIHAASLYYEAAEMAAVPRSSFSWDLRLVWTRIPHHEEARRGNPADPFRAPVLVGCAFAVERRYFRELGGFDPDMEIWGGENFEVPFRAWLCGGSVLTVPCSRVGHTFRRLPYLMGTIPHQIERNLLRTAELWMGEYKRWVYGAIPDQYHLNETDLASIERRRAQLEHLNCRGFDWYLQTLLPEVPVPPEDVELFGEVGNIRWTACLAVMHDGTVGLTAVCFQARLIPENFFYIDSLGRLVHAPSARCVKMDVETRMIFVVTCGDLPPGGDDGHWHFRRRLPRRAGHLVLRRAGGGAGGGPRGRDELCLTQTNAVLASVPRRVLMMKGCKKEWAPQVWLWTYDFDLNRVRDHRQ